MSKVANRTPVKLDNRGSGDHRRETGGGRNDRGDKSHSHGRSDSSSRNKHSDHKPSSGENANQAHDEKNTSTETKSTEEKKFTGRCRLFVGNLTPDVSEDDFKKMFEPYGEVSEVYVNTSRGFGFIRLDYRQNAEAAKAALDGLQRKGRVLRVRFATHGAALRVKNLHHFVSNELLEQAFTQFGELERAIVIVDDRGKPTGEGLVEFVRKPGAQQALRRINEGVFLFGADPKPIEVEPLEQRDEEDGMPEKFLPKNDMYKKEREKEPHFAPHGSFEYEFGIRWKQLDEMEKKRIENVKKEMEEARIKLEDEMQNALYDYQAEQIRQDLLRQQEELRRLEELRNNDRMRRQQELEMRTMNRRAEEERTRQQEERRRQEIMMRQQEMQRRSGGGHMDSGMPPRSREEMMSMRAGEGPSGFQGGPSSMGMRGGQGQGGDPQMQRARGGAPPMQPPPAPPAGMGLERGGQQGMGRMPQGGGGQGGQGSFGGQGGHPGSSGGGNPNGSASPNINSMGGQGGPGGAASQMDAENCNHCLDQPESDIPHQPLASTPSQFEDADDELMMTHNDRLPDHGHWLPPPAGSQPDDPLDTDMAVEEEYSAMEKEYSAAEEYLAAEEYSAVEKEYSTVGKEYVVAEEGEGYSSSDMHDRESEYRDWTSGEQNPFSGIKNGTSSSDFNTENGGWYHESSDQRVDSMHSDRSDVLAQPNAPEGGNLSSDRQWMDMEGSIAEHSTGDVQSSAQEMSFSDGHDALEGHSFHEGDCITGENNPSNGHALNEDDTPHEEPDDSLALVPYVSPSVSPSTSPSPPPFSTGPTVASNIAAAATGVPLHPNPLGVGQTRFVRIHPLHIAAAVAAQRSRAAAVIQQQNQMAAAAVQQQAQSRMAAAAAAVQQQQAQNRMAAAAAAVHQQQAQSRMAAAAVLARQQRTQAAMMHQQLVRSRYMGAPVLVRQPFVPVPRVAAPMRSSTHHAFPVGVQPHDNLVPLYRVRMRVRRSVVLTEELSVDHP